MADQLLGEFSKDIVKKLCIGANRYSSQRGKAGYLNCVDSYPDSEDNHGQFAIQFRITYDETAQVLAQKPTLLTPVVVTLEGSFQTFAGEQRFVPSALLSAVPYRPASLSASSAPVAQASKPEKTS